MTAALYRPVLTIAQRAVARRIANGLTRGQVARELDISVNTVGEHMKAISMRLGGEGSLRLRIREFMGDSPPPE